MSELLTEPEVMKWFNRIYLSLAWRKPVEDVWDRVNDYLESKYFSELSDEDRVAVNMVHPHIRVVVPAIYSRNPDISVLPGRVDDMEDELVLKRAEVLMRLLKYEFRELKVKQEVKLCILDACLTGLAWVKTGYETQIETYKTPIAKQKKDDKTVISKVLEGLGIKDSEEEEQFQVNEKVSSESPWALRVSPYNMIIPALGIRPDELSWIGDRRIVEYEEFMDTTDMDTTGLKPSANANDVLASLSRTKYDRMSWADEAEYVVLYEICHKKSKKVITLAEGHKKALEVKDCQYGFLNSKFHTYVTLRFNELMDRFYPMSDIEPAESQIEELNEMRTKMSIHTRRYNRRYVTRPGAFEPKAQEELKAGEDGAVIECTDKVDEHALPDIIHSIVDAAMPAEVFAFEARVKEDLSYILGTRDYASDAGNQAETATAASLEAQKGRLRVAERIDLIEEFVASIATNLAMISQAFMTGKQVAEILGSDAIFWKQIKDYRLIRREFLFTVIPGSTAPVNKDTRRQQFNEFYAQAINDPYYNQVKLRLQNARERDLDNPDSWLEPTIVMELERQRLVALKQGLLLEGAINAPGSKRGASGGKSQGAGRSLPTGQPEGLPGDLGRGSGQPTRNGGTNLA